MKRALIHFSNLNHFIGYLTSIQEGFREKPFQLTSDAMKRIADDLDRFKTQLDECAADIHDDYRNRQGWAEYPKEMAEMKGRTND